jgi:hypothetical protein
MEQWPDHVYCYGSTVRDDVHGYGYRFEWLYGKHHGDGKSAGGIISYCEHDDQCVVLWELDGRSNGIDNRRYHAVSLLMEQWLGGSNCEWLIFWFLYGHGHGRSWMYCEQQYDHNPAKFRVNGDDLGYEPELRGLNHGFSHGYSGRGYWQLQLFMEQWSDDRDLDGLNGWYPFGDGNGCQWLQCSEDLVVDRSDGSKCND